MCGIFGHIGKIEPTLVRRCTNTLEHRGPDTYGEWLSKDASFGHRRLAILDLSDLGGQPMESADGRYILVFNGEIYNFIEIRHELEKKGHKFRSDSDSEVVLEAFIEWGKECHQKFNGMWAFAIWDKREKILFLSRDRFGIKPLFYTCLPGGRFAFASEMKALFPLLGEVRPNKPLIRDYGRIFLYESTDECVIQGIKRFPAGHYGYYRNGGVLSLTRWWCTLDHLPDIPSRYEEQVEQFKELFVDSCRLRMRSDVPIGTALSGGLDSSATISTMAHIAKSGNTQRMGNWQHAFIASFPGTPLDETKYALKITDHIGIDANVIEIDPTQAVDRLEKYFYLFEDLYITSPIPFMLTYGAVKAYGISVTLDGHGADEIFAGYPFDFMDALLDAGLKPSAINDILTTYYASFSTDAQVKKLPPKVLFFLEWYARKIARYLLRRPSARFTHTDCDHLRWKDLDHLGRRLYISTHGTILPTLLRNYDRYSMANSVEIRMPFMDYRIVAFAFALPWTSKIRNGFSKAIIRDAVSQFMPHEIAYRKTKIGFNSPIVDWIKGPLREYLLDMISSASFISCDLVDYKKAGQVVRRVIENPDATFGDGELAWKLINPFLWEQSLIKARV